MNRMFVQNSEFDCFVILRMCTISSLVETVSAVNRFQVPHSHYIKSVQQSFFGGVEWDHSRRKIFRLYEKVTRVLISLQADLKYIFNAKKIELG